MKNRHIKSARVYDLLSILIFTLQNGKKILRMMLLFTYLIQHSMTFGYGFCLDSPNYIDITVYGGSLEGVLVMRYFCNIWSFGEVNQFILK